METLNKSMGKNALFIVGIMLIFSVFILSNVSASTTTTIVNSTEDTYYFTGGVSDNGGGTQMLTGDSGSSTDKHSVIKFPLPTTAGLQSAILVLYYEDADGESSFDARNLMFIYGSNNQTWNENDCRGHVTLFPCPAINTTIESFNVTTRIPDLTPRQVNFTVTSFVNSTINLGNSNVTFDLNSTWPTPGNGAQYRFATKENTNLTRLPVLYLTYTDVSINIVAPSDDQEFDTNLSLPLNFTQAGPISTIWYNIDNGANTTITGNITFNTSDGSHTAYLFANDTNGNLFSDSVNFTVSLSAPAITLDAPDDGTYFNNGTGIYLNYTATDSNGIGQCDVYHDVTGSWALNSTNLGITSGQQNFTQVYGSDGSYTWNVFCNDTLGNGRFSTTNHTFIIDETLPLISNINVATADNSQTFNFSFTLTETNQGTCKYSVYDSDNTTIDGLNENVSITCGVTSQGTATGFGTFTLRVYHTDLAGNENHTDKAFTLTQTSGDGSGGGGGGSTGGENVELIPVVGLNQLEDRTYSELEREVIYAKINRECGSKQEGGNGNFIALIDYSGTCTLILNDLDSINKEISELGFSIPSSDLALFFKSYNAKDFYQGFEKREDVIKYGLFTSVLGIPNPMTILPSTLRRPFFKFSLEKSFNITYNFIVNKNIRDCTVLEGGPALTCEVITNNTFAITYEINETAFFDKVFTGRVSVTSEAEEQNLEVRDVPLVLTIYNFAAPVLGVPAYILLSGIVVIILVIGVVYYSNKRFRKKLFRRKK